MHRYIKITLGIFLVLAASRFIPHPPNFTSLLALSFYIPAILGIGYLPALVFSFFVTDFIIGFHSVTFFTWGSVILIGLGSKFFIKNIYTRISGSILGALLFFIITNFGVWSTGMYGYTINGFFECYIMAIPFFNSTLISTLLFSIVIETCYLFYNIKFSRS